MELDEKTQELFDAAQDCVLWQSTKESKSSLPDYPVCLERLRLAVEALKNKSTAQILNEVRAAMIDLRLVEYLLKGSTDVKTAYKALNEAIQAWNDAQ